MEDSKYKTGIIRSLNNIEEAFTISNANHPLSAVIVLHLASAPTSEKLRLAVNKVQERHLLLRAVISKEKGEFVFVRSPSIPDIPIEIVDRKEANTWIEVTEKGLNTSLPVEGPLMQINYVLDANHRQGEIIIAFHHAIIDGNSARLILDEILSIAGGQDLVPVAGIDTSLQNVTIRPRKLYRDLFNFFKLELIGEWQYRKNGFRHKPASNSENRIIHLRFSDATSKKLKAVCAQKGLNLNNLLLAALTQSILFNKYSKKKAGLVRVINFANLGLNLKPPVRPDDLGCYISMLRLTIPYSQKSDVVSMATAIRRSLVSLGRTDTIKLMAWLSKYLVKMTLLLKNRRMGVSALSYIGNLDLQQTYGSIELKDVHAYITNNQYGPEFSAFGKILHGKIGLDFTYLTAETKEIEANIIVDDIKQILDKVANIS